MFAIQFSIWISQTIPRLGILNRTYQVCRRAFRNDRHVFAFLFLPLLRGKFASDLPILLSDFLNGFIIDLGCGWVEAGYVGDPVGGAEVLLAGGVPGERGEVEGPRQAVGDAEVALDGGAAGEALPTGTLLAREGAW